jgi:hypothetical protein
MGKRGPQPVDMRLLNWWESAFHRAFRSLRDGMGVKPLPPSGLTKHELRSFIAQLKGMTPEHYWLTTKRLAAEMGNRVSLPRPPVEMDRTWAEQQRDDDVRSLRRELNPPDIEAQERRRKIWDDLVKADSFAALRKSCGRWAQLPDVRRAGTTSFPKHIMEDAAQFLALKRNARFPRSRYGDDSRIDYLARGMAGVLVGKSPITGVERLRNMKHTQGGPLWVTQEGNRALPEDQQYCGCWRCRKDSLSNISKLTQTGYENGLRYFIELSATTRVPKDWIRSRKKL